jgi:hypothetical protein
MPPLGEKVTVTGKMDGDTIEVASAKRAKEQNCLPPRWRDWSSRQPPSYLSPLNLRAIGPAGPL